jgi:hypothetical protein
MKRLNLSLGLCITALILLFVACDENGEETDPLVGTYVFEYATFNDTVHITVQQQEMAFPPGTDAATFVGPGLLGAAPCDNAENAAIELKEDGTVYFACLNETNEEQMGTWSINKERTELTLNISTPAPFLLNITDLDATTTSFAGTVTNFPLPIDASIDIGQPLPQGGFNYQTASVDISFKRAP